ncbi:MAG: GNAT family N-acetyltransferase [Actinomycetota bacterium]|nr:GNAT family N-acetyltransferase [Actinomycetota bacterium]
MRGKVSIKAYEIEGKMLAFTTREDVEMEETAARGWLRAVSESDARVRQMNEADLERILELRSVVRWSADPRAFDLLRGVRDARWAVAEAPDGSLVGMVGAVPLGSIGILCHLAVHDEHRGSGLGARLSAWAVAYLRSRGVGTIRLYSTRRAEGLYRSLGFAAVAPRTVYRLEASRGAFGRAPETSEVHSVETLAFGDLPELYGVDRWSYGADRSALVFATLRLHPGLGLVARDSSGRISGYLIRSSAGRTTRIGPFLAATPDVARRLLTRALEGTRSAPVQVAVPGPAGCPAHALLEEFGFVGRPDRLRMELGGTSSAACRAGLVHYGTTPYLAT